MLCPTRLAINLDLDIMLWAKDSWLYGSESLEWAGLSSWIIAATRGSRNI
jgi:hypothetical protein